MLVNLLLAGHPESMRRLFNLEDFSTGSGFLNAELFSSLLPLMMIFYAVARGARPSPPRRKSACWTCCC